MTTKELADLYLSVGAGGVLIIVFLVIFVYYILRIRPVLEQISSDSKVNMEITKNSTKAVNEMARSNDNVANALELLRASIESSNQNTLKLYELFEKHDDRAESLQKEVVRLIEIVRTNKPN